MQLNKLERAIAAALPSWAVSRAKARVQIDALQQLPDMTASSQDATASGSSSSARRWWNPMPRDARTDTLRFLPSQRGASRDLARTSPIAVGAINTNIDRVVGTGLALSAQPALKVLGWTPEQALEWKAHVHNEFSLWADSTECDIEQTLNFYQQQALVLRAVLESGDCFTILPDGKPTATQPYALRIQVLEADRIGNPAGQVDTASMAGGVRLGEGGAPEAFHVYDQHPGGYLPGSGGMYAGRWVDRVGSSGRRRVLHHFRKLRPGLPRGLPYLAPIIDCIKQISRYTEAEIMAAVITAYLTVFIETPSGNAAPVFDGTTAGAGAPGNEIGLGQGAVVGLAPGEKATSVNPGRPNPNFGPFIESVITQIGMALSLPRELLIKQFNSSYSASKAALLDAWVYFRSVRTWLALSFCQPIFETWLTEAVARGRVPAVGFFADPLLRWAYTRAAWPGDSIGSINPKDEVAAYSAAIDARLMSRERAEWELWGSDWNDTYAQKYSEHQRLRDDGMLPAPKAGAAAPVTTPSNPPTTEET
ncbi:MAG: phage portal protein [Hydrogenophaga sp.]|uniref:phage portal protein n=1 Tax=Hydrogenophaga sp. TaxID=1904254 RepID=UPI002AB93DA8|nr:phage portal protein [Hydrogenophaga sp.]MDZ4282811.1 phage portal protein [Hydrogenophaga sp.]